MLGNGYPEKSTILIAGPAGIGKEALNYWFTYSGLAQGEPSIYITRLGIQEILQDVQGFGIDLQQHPPIWFLGVTREASFGSGELEKLSTDIKSVLSKNDGRRIRIATDILSPLLVYNPFDSVYKFLNQLFSEVKEYNAVLLATLEDGMHKTEILASMQHLFDGVLELKMYEQGLRAVPLLRVRKMRGVPPLPDFSDFTFTKTGIEIRTSSKELGIRGWLRGPR